VGSGSGTAVQNGEVGREWATGWPFGLGREEASNGLGHVRRGRRGEVGARLRGGFSLRGRGKRVGGPVGLSLGLGQGRPCGRAMW
jgi:hypothetical protein